LKIDQNVKQVVVRNKEDVVDVQVDKVVAVVVAVKDVLL
jgi:hypothetical protein